MNEGWIKLYRKVFDNGLSNHKPYCKLAAWIFMIAMANHKEGCMYVRGNKIVVGRGQLGWSQDRLADQFGWSRGKVKRFLDDLETVQQIIQHKNYITSLITITNYDLYQCSDTANDTTDGRQTVQQTDTNKNDKKKKNEKNKEEEEVVEYEEIKNYWNSKNNLPKIRALSKDRKKHFNSRLKEPFFIENWRSAIDRLSESDFCTGRNDRGWKADIDFLICNDTNIVKIIEGKYNRGPIKKQFSRKMCLLCGIQPAKDGSSECAVCEHKRILAELGESA